MAAVTAKKAIGQKVWVVPEGYLPEWSQGARPELESHGTLSMLNTSGKHARVEITLYFNDRAPVGPYHINVPARRTRHLRFDELGDPEEVPRGVDFASVIESDLPIVVQYTRLDTRQAAAALMTTMAYPAG